MSISHILDRFLTTTIHIFRESTVADSVGDLATSLSLAYASLKANIQPKTDDTQFEIQGRIHVQDHVAYINYYEGDAIRDIHIGDQVYDEKTTKRYMVLGVENWEAANVNITDSHHVKIIMKAVSGIPEKNTQVLSVEAGAKIT